MNSFIWTINVTFGVNTFLSSKGSPTVLPKEVIRATEDEKQYQIEMLNN